MVNMDTPLADQVFRYLFAGSIALMITGRMLEVAMTKLDGNIHWQRDRLNRIVGNDYVVFLVALVVSLAAWLPAVWASSPSYVIDLLSTIRHELGFLGWVISIAVLINFFAPLMVAMMLVIGKMRRNRRYGDPLPYLSGI